MSVTMVLLLVVMVFSAIIGIVLILLQSGNAAADSGQTGGSAEGIFGSRGPNGFLARATTIVAVVFFLSVLAINYEGIKAPAAGSSVVTTSKPSSAAMVNGVETKASEAKSSNAVSQ
jgi:preprotein translocase subunit SecG